LWFQEFQIKPKPQVFFFHFLVVYTRICFACQDGKAAPFSAGKFGGCEEHWNFLMNMTCCMPQNMQQLSSSLIGCILYGMELNVVQSILTKISD